MRPQRLIRLQLGIAGIMACAVLGACSDDKKGPPDDEGQTRIQKASCGATSNAFQVCAASLVEGVALSDDEKSALVNGCDHSSPDASDLYFATAATLSATCR